MGVQRSAEVAEKELPLTLRVSETLRGKDEWLDAFAVFGKATERLGRRADRDAV